MRVHLKNCPCSLGLEFNLDCGNLIGENDPKKVVHLVADLELLIGPCDLYQQVEFSQSSWNWRCSDFLLSEHFKDFSSMSAICSDI